MVGYDLVDLDSVDLGSADWGSAGLVDWGEAEEVVSCGLYLVDPFPLRVVHLVLDLPGLPVLLGLGLQVLLGLGPQVLLVLLGAPLLAGVVDPPVVVVGLPVVVVGLPVVVVVGLVPFREQLWLPGVDFILH